MMEVEVDTKIDNPVSSLAAVENLKQTAVIMDHEGSEEKLFVTPNVCSNSFNLGALTIIMQLIHWQTQFKPIVIDSSL